MGISTTTNGQVHFSGIDAASYLFHTEKGVAKLLSVFFLFFLLYPVPVDKSYVTSLIQTKRDTLFIETFLLQERKITHAQPSPAFITFQQQQYQNDCGAQALRQATHELNITRIPKSNLCMFNGQRIADRTAEDAIYGITGNLLNEIRSFKVTPPQHGGYSYPANMLQCANLLGLNGRFYCSSLLTRIYMSTTYDKEWTEANQYSPINHCSPPVLYDNERLLVVVSQGSQLHYIMQRPDKTCYDPGTGFTYKTLKEYSTKTHWKPSGISILVCNPEGYPATPQPTSPDGTSTHQNSSQVT